MTRPKTVFSPMDEPLRDDVHRLLSLVGEVIREQSGPALFERVEACRDSADERRKPTDRETADSPASDMALEALLQNRSPETAELLCRAFLMCFRMVNLAERIHRIRRRREYVLADDGPQEGSWADVLQTLDAEGVTSDAVLNALSSLSFEPVFTAHATASSRRTLLAKELRIAHCLGRGLQGPRTADERKSTTEAIRTEIAAIWQTEPHPTARPTVRDEREHVLYHLTETAYAALPTLLDELQQALAATYDLSPGALDDRLDALALLCCGSAVGGDMDGNPYVTADTIKASLARHREVILGIYVEELEELADRLSQSESRIAVSQAVRDRIQDYERLLPEGLDGVPTRHRDMPYRVLLHLMTQRLERSRSIQSLDESAYAGPDVLLMDLGLIRDSLRQHKGQRAGARAVRRLQQRVQAFGFHLASLDQRQDSALHREVMGHLLIDDRWIERPSSSRTRRLRQLLPRAGPRSTPAGSPASVHQALAVFRALADARRRGMEDRAFGPFVVSMAEGPDDVLTVLLLARWGGLLTDEGVPLDVAPLFETVDDIRAAPDILRQLLDLPAYRHHLAQRGGRQTVMIDYSDANKDSGLFTSRWALRRAQIEMVKVTADYPGIELIFFHGRGGTISRGRGKTRRAVLTSPAGTFSGRLRMTEQGEMISSRYGLEGLATRTLEEAMGAQLEVMLRPDQSTDDTEQWQALADTMDQAAREAYLELIYGERKLYRYFRLATPIDVIERLMSSSRPNRRRTRAGIANLRAIPWVLAWTQSRHVLPGWFGLGTGLDRACKSHGRTAVVDAIKSWPFLCKIISDAEMVLAKTDMGIARRYSELAGDLGQVIFPRIEQEHELTRSLILELKEQDHLLADDPPLRLSIDLRNPYVDSMSLLQVDLLHRWRGGGREDSELLKALVASVHGVAQGLKNTG